MIHHTHITTHVHHRPGHRFPLHNYLAWCDCGWTSTSTLIHNQAVAQTERHEEDMMQRHVYVGQARHDIDNGDQLMVELYVDEISKEIQIVNVAARQHPGATWGPPAQCEVAP